MAKRLFDLVLASVGLVITSPIWMVSAIGIKLSSKGPVFFRQERIGRHFSPFRIFKFRTMYDGAEGPLITARGDRRVTPVGRILRRTKFDELPQLLNVINGEMSLVGPRPEVRQYVERFRSDYEEILTVRPGITDPASLAFRYEDKVLSSVADPESLYVGEILPRKLALAKHYIRTRNLLADIVLVLRTLLHL